MKIGPALEHLHAGERDLAHDLRAVAERHATDHAVYHVGNMLADRCEELAAGLGPFLAEYGEDEPDDKLVMSLIQGPTCVLDVNIR